MYFKEIDKYCEILFNSKKFNHLFLQRYNLKDLIKCVLMHIINASFIALLGGKNSSLHGLRM